MVALTYELVRSFSSSCRSTSNLWNLPRTVEIIICLPEKWISLWDGSTFHLVRVEVEVWVCELEKVVIGFSSPPVILVLLLTVYIYTIGPKKRSVVLKGAVELA